LQGGLSKREDRAEEGKREPQGGGEGPEIKDTGPFTLLGGRVIPTMRGSGCRRARGRGTKIVITFAMRSLGRKDRQVEGSRKRRCKTLWETPLKGERPGVSARRNRGSKRELQSEEKGACSGLFLRREAIRKTKGRHLRPWKEEGQRAPYIEKLRNLLNEEKKEEFYCPRGSDRENKSHVTSTQASQGKKSLLNLGESWHPGSREKDGYKKKKGLLDRWTRGNKKIH